MPLARHDDLIEVSFNRYGVSTHMPLARHDSTFMNTFFTYEFLLTCLLRGMTICLRQSVNSITVSTHMPLARHDGDLYDSSR